MEVFDESAACKGKVGKQGVEYLLQEAATAERCQAACLQDKKCKYAALIMKGSRQKWTCVKFPKKCKISKQKKGKKNKGKKLQKGGAVTYKKTKVEASQIDDPKFFILE